MPFRNGFVINTNLGYSFHLYIPRRIQMYIFHHSCCRQIHYNALCMSCCKTYHTKQLHRNEGKLQFQHHKFVLMNYSLKTDTFYCKDYYTFYHKSHRHTHLHKYHLLGYIQIHCTLHCNYFCMHSPKRNSCSHLCNIRSLFHISIPHL